MDKNNIINNVYKDKSGFSSIQKLIKKPTQKTQQSLYKTLGIGLLKMSKERNS
jgi:hypothetical protein